MGHHRECDMSVPTVPMTHFILIQAGLAFAFLDALLNGIARGGDLGQAFEDSVEAYLRGWEQER